MSAAALMDWMGKHMPHCADSARSYGNLTDFHAYMGTLSGVRVTFGRTHDESCAAYLDALKQKYPNGLHLDRRQPTDQRKQAPLVPPEVWRMKPEVDTTDYMAAVRAMCGGAS